MGIHTRYYFVIWQLNVHHKIQMCICAYVCLQTSVILTLTFTGGQFLRMPSTSTDWWVPSLHFNSVILQASYSRVRLPTKLPTSVITHMSNLDEPLPVSECPAFSVLQPVNVNTSSPFISSSKANQPGGGGFLNLDGKLGKNIQIKYAVEKMTGT